MRRRSRGLRIPHFPGRVSARRRRELALVFALIFGVCGGASRLAAVGVPFTARPSISTTAVAARSVLTADIDGDGDLDTLSASGGNDRIAWHENTNGSGAVWSEEIVTTDADFAQSVFAADVDGDGDLDVLSASSLDDAIVWYENTGAGPGWNATTISSAADAAVSVFAADVDGDGDVDVLSASNADDKIAWYENENGDGTSWTPHTIAIGTSATGVDGAISVFAADLDGDGDLDIASASFLHDKIAWHKNVLGDGSSWTTHSIDTTADGARRVVAADVDGDGDQDLLSACVGDDSVLWHENLGGLGASWATATISSVDEATGVWAADVDADGDVDAVSASRLDDEIAWHENVAGDGSSWIARTLSTTADRAYSVFTGDVDGDGDVDVLAASADDNEISWYENRAIHRSALLEERLVITTEANGTYATFAADVDGDGDVDTLSAVSSGNTIEWYENEPGDGTSWTSRTVASVASASSRSVFAADVDGDGDVDAIAGFAFTTPNDEISWYENVSGDGSSWTPRSITTTADGTRALFAIDIDGDGDTDVVSASTQDDEIAWYENELGNGTSWTAYTISSNLDQPHSLAVADVDGDGDVDVVSASLSEDTVAWFENSGDGSSWTEHTLATIDGARFLSAADVDGDGDVDIFSSATGNPRLVWFENSLGDGTSWAAHLVANLNNAATSVFGADLDGDGDVDALMSRIDDRIFWFENATGDGGSWSAHTVTTTVDGPQYVIVADIDGDGDLDALAASRDDDTIAWYPNRGGQFALPTVSLAQSVLANSQEDVALQIDLEHRGRTDDSDVELGKLELRLENGAGTPLTTPQANELIDKLELFLDDGSGGFDSPADTLVEVVSTLSLAGGVQSILLDTGDPAAQVALGESKRYFVVVTMTATAASQPPADDQFELIHLTESSSSARDASTTSVPLRLEFHPDTATGLVDTDLTSATCKAPFELDLTTFTVTSTVVCEAGTTLTAGNGLTVSPTGDLSLRAGQRVRFVTNFSVESGGALATEVDPSLEP